LERAALRGLFERSRHAVFRVPELTEARVGESVEDGCAGLPQSVARIGCQTLKMTIG
jgi:hypothetical protein